MCEQSHPQREAVGPEWRRPVMLTAAMAVSVILPALSCVAPGTPLHLSGPQKRGAGTIAKSPLTPQLWCSVLATCRNIPSWNGHLGGRAWHLYSAGTGG